MSWPENPNCHEDEVKQRRYEGFELTWSPPELEREPASTPFRTCSWCGSIHPEDLVRAAADYGLSMELADRKYNYPHKIYIHGIPNPLAGKTVQIGSKSSRERSEPIMGTASDFTHAKWYNWHLWDDGYGKREQEVLLGVLSLCGTTFFMTPDGGLRWQRAPTDEIKH